MSDLAPDRDSVGTDPALAPDLRPIRWSRVGPVAVIASLVLAFALAGPRLWHSVRSDPTASIAVEALPSATQDALASQLPTEQAPKPLAGQVAVLGRFAARDPFAAPASAQVASAQAPATTTAISPPAAAPPVEAAAPAATTPAATPTPATTPTVTPNLAPTAPTSAPVTTPGAATTLPAADPAASTVTLSINGVAEQVAVKGLFPAADPIFRLAALGATSVQIAVAGGATATGDQTVTLTQGRSLTLLDTASGARYELRLLETPTSSAVAPSPPDATTTLP